jgi:methanethiol S-methyltransferase
VLSSVLIIAGFFAVYALIHSLLATIGFKQWLKRVFGAASDRWYRLAYNLFAGLTLLPLVPLLALLPDQRLYFVPSPWRWFMVAGQGLAVVGATISLLQAGLFDFLGLSQLVSEQVPLLPAEAGSLRTDGLYGWMRHPLYSFSILFLWLTPAMTVNLLATFALFTFYFYLGSVHEERRLRAEFGSVYRDYQRQVPRFVPRPGRNNRSQPETSA